MIVSRGDAFALGEVAAARGATLLLHGRDEECGQTTLAEIARATRSDQLAWYRADLSSLAETRRLAEAVGRDHTRLYVLVSNAGVGTDVPRRQGSTSATVCRAHKTEIARAGPVTPEIATNGIPHDQNPAHRNLDAAATLRSTPTPSEPWPTAHDQDRLKLRAPRPAHDC